MSSPTLADWAWARKAASALSATISGVCEDKYPGDEGINIQNRRGSISGVRGDQYPGYKGGYEGILDPGYKGILDPGYEGILDPGYKGVLDPGYEGILDPGYEVY